ncbi:oligosaccharide flippase family protein [Peribacillus frigoritolerans]|uniref:lipopolysaccharide biosynthesis protein n=1 Tax=Peribacillus frigoritolerans TaxID=450367 RepID=UPI0024BF6D5A|nr:oligosaccharide flippase family protein [Peribacillus frigoritolerans]WHY12584.1 oligosaccharide flippase family protein [Peribacillus frigoritolerans]
MTKIKRNSLNSLLNEKFIVKIKDKSFIQSVFVLVRGTAIGQGLLILASPFLTRFYSPEDFGLLAAYVSILSILVVIASLRYELAIPIAKSNVTANNLLVLSLTIVFGFTLLITTLLIFFHEPLLDIINSPSLEKYLWLLPISLFGAGIYKVLNYSAIRKGKFKQISKTKVNQSIGTVVIQLGIGLCVGNPIGLFIGDAVGRITGSSSLLKSVISEEKKNLKKCSLRAIKVAAIRYRKFPLISSISSLFNTAGLQLPQLLIMTFFGAHIAGLFSLVQRVIGFPMTMVGQSVSQVYLSEVSKMVNNSSKDIKPMFLRTSLRLLAIGIIPILILSFYGPSIFAMVFGDMWREAGEYSKLLGLMFLLQFIVSPLSQTLNILEYQSWQLIWDIARFLTVIVVFLLSNFFHLAPTVSIFLYGITMSIAYLVLYILSYVAIIKFKKVEVIKV